MAQNRRIALPLRTVQRILLALMSGVGLFATMAVLLRSSVSPNAALRVPLLGTLVGVTALAIVTYVFTRRSMRARLSGRKGAAQAELKAGFLPAELAGLAILGAALAEGVGLLGVVTFLLTHSWPALVAPGLAMALIAVQVPTIQRASDALRAIS